MKIKMASFAFIALFMSILWQFLNSYDFFLIEMQSSQSNYFILIGLLNLDFCHLEK